MQFDRNIHHCCVYSIMKHFACLFLEFPGPKFFNHGTIDKNMMSKTFPTVQIFSLVLDFVVENFMFLWYSNSKGKLR